ncbi:hypothetical protein PTKIN_Ptkin13bG0219900 [Pterospermum kingtungense]
MMVCSPISTCAENVVHLRSWVSGSICSVISRGPSGSYCYCLFSGPKTKYNNLAAVSNTISGSPAIGFHELQAGCFHSSRRSGTFQSLTVKESISDKGKQKRQFEVSCAGQSMKLRLSLPKQGTLQKFKCIGGPIFWPPGCVYNGLAFGLLICYPSSEPAHAEAAGGKEGQEDECESFHGKRVYTDYSVIGIRGDGRCLFRSVVQGACLRSGKSTPSGRIQRELADDLRAEVADEFIKRRKETEWFVEGDFDTYVSQIRKPHVWGGEPELFMASHVLQIPITVYMHDRDAGGLVSIAEYGQEYGTENPIRVLYHGFGHYDALIMPARKPVVSSLNSDGLSLLALKAAIESDPTRSLHKWSESDSTPCHWPGIACTRNRVTSVFLPNKGLTGYIPSELGLLDSLTRLSLSQNNFSKPIPSCLFNATNLVYIDLSYNSLSGPVPPQIKSLENLSHLDLSSNSLNGSLPESLVELKSLTGTLNLSYNEFSGEIPASYGEFPVMISLDLRHNNLTGKVPQIGSLLNQGPTAFSGNPNLCGFPLGNLCPEAQNPRAILNPEENPENPKGLNPISDEGYEGKRQEKNGSVAVPLISGVSVVIGAVSVFVWLLRRKWKSGEGKMGKQEKSEEVDEDEGQKGKFVVVDEGFNLELEDLLRASAYVVGKSRSGIVYKVVAGRGSSMVGTTVVAVRRLSEGDGTWKLKEFEAEVEAIGRVNHPNVLRLRAYYYANDEKLLVTDFIRNGSLYAALHGRSSNNLPPLTWAARLRIVQGTARGLMYIHEFSPRKYVHGNLKSTKVLLDNELQPYISGFGLTRLVSGTSKYASSITKKLSSSQAIATTAAGSRISASPNSYLAPEARVYGSKFTQKCDVYSFGIVLLEILTGRLPDAGPENDDKGLEGLVRKAFREERPLSEIIDPTLLTEVHAKKQVVAAFHIALNCAELDPELRPRMRTVSESLDRIKCQ